MARVMATANFWDMDADGGDVFRHYGDEWDVDDERAERLVGYRIVSVIGKTKAPKPKPAPKARPKAKAKAKPKAKGKE